MGRIIVRPQSLTSPSSQIAGTGGEGWVQTFFDDFNGTAGSAPDSSKWIFDTDNDYPGAQDAKFRTQNRYLNGSSCLVIEAKAESFGGTSWTSAQIATLTKFQQTGGKFEFYAQMPAGGGGIWPGLWLLGDNWPHDGEIDILEMWTGTMDTAQMHYHYWNGSAPDQSGASYFNSALATGFHKYGVEWDPGTEIRWYIDDVLRQTYTNANVSSSPMWFMIDLYIGGFTAPVTASFPQYLLVDWVRAYQRA